MASIYIRNSNRTIQTNPAISVLNNLLRKGVSISHQCGGKAICGTCRIKIIENIHNVSPLQEREKNKLEFIAAGNTPGGNPLSAPADVRLACQSYVVGHVGIKILARGSRPKEDEPKKVKPD